MLGSGNNLTRGVDVPPLPQCLPLEPIRLGNQKYTRSGELRRVLGVSSITSSEDSTFGFSCPKSSPPVVTGELKHFKERMQDTSREAGAKKLGESIFKLDKYAEVLTSKKRRRSDISPGERMDAVNMDKVRSQIPDERKKMFGLDKRARTSVVDVRGDGRVSALLRQQVTEKDSDSLPGIPGETMRIEEKIRRLEAKTKRKRSVAALGNRVINSDRRGMQPKLIADSKLRSCDTQNYRSKSSAASGINRLDAFSRNELESVSFARDRSALVEQRIMAKGNSKKNLKDNNLANSSSAALKGKVSRAPGTGAIMTAEPSSRVETPSRALQAGSSPHAMTQWVGQRPHKNSRTRRTNVVSPFMKHTENKTSSQGFATSDFSSRAFPGTTGSFSAVDNTSLKVKRVRKNTSSPCRLSESEGSEGGDNKPREHDLENGEVTTTRKTGALLLSIRKNKIYSGHNGDCTWKQGKGGNSSSLITPGFHPITVKTENRPREKPIQNSKIAADKNKSKSGRPPTRKLKDRKASTRLGSNAITVSSDAAGESDDDCEDLFAAANSARNAANHACSGEFWKKMEYIFAPVSPDDMQYMKDQLSFVEELGESLREATTNVYNIMGILMRKAPQGPGDDTADFSNQPSSISDLSFERMDMRKLNESTLYKRALSALIEEDNGEEVVEVGEVKNLSLHYVSDDYHCGSCTHIDTETRERDRTESEVESSAEFQTLKDCLFDRFSRDMSVMSNSFRSVSVPIPDRSNKQWLGDDDLSHSKVALGGKICSNNPSQLQPREMIVPDFPSTETQYQLLSLDDRLLLELHSIGIYPEELPDLAEETISTDVLKLKEDVYQQIQNMKKLLGKINMTIQKSEDGERRKIEYLAMDQLVEMAHRKRVASRGSKASKECKVSRQVAMAFIKRTVARCRKLEETGRSCFADPALQDVLFSSPGNNTKSSEKGGFGTGTARNSPNETSNHQVEARGSGAVSSSTKRGEALMDKATATSPDSGGHGNGRKAKPRQENSNQPTGPASSNPEEEALEEMALKELGSLEESGDMGNWFDGLQDIHTVGLEIPMDDLSDVNLLL
ncbi:PREDICTED: uncharacterized protein LOC104799550 isoform X4 [Tarenaya hassleriana]|uniref:uncharacterized protein LOC104799550 isoform X4 n=1 Tax=Tarenaya hassleriana TaxID=28532 RepID=UPI00053C23B6|nr:PREDICTED: uncharacterized protein LOC104799550 isoform X4 [Tarenaya hassleriana]